MREKEAEMAVRGQAAAAPGEVLGQAGTAAGIVAADIVAADSIARADTVDNVAGRLPATVQRLLEAIYPQPRQI
ncbi:MAG: hypothetical protein GX307_02910 [Euryarchaeota archaeon]|nr:hypothetical protein [Euryarchaeota archaeon]